MKISATIGLLTYNSEKNLSRALLSVKDFADIIVADGGSNDRTLVIAKEYGARIISQSNPGHPISDFALERNRLLDSANQKWFFYLDSDEIMSKELKNRIQKIATSDKAGEFGAYRVRYSKTNTEASQIYRTYKEYYQIRLVRTDIGARFEQPVHERIKVPGKVSIGQIEEQWYVPLGEDDLSVSAFAHKAWERTAGEVRNWQPKGPINIVFGVLIHPLTLIVKSIIKMVVVKFRFGGNAIPARYELLRILYAIFLSLQSLRRVIIG